MSERDQEEQHPRVETRKGTHCPINGGSLQTQTEENNLISHENQNGLAMGSVATIEENVRTSMSRRQSGDAAERGLKVGTGQHQNMSVYVEQTGQSKNGQGHANNGKGEKGGKKQKGNPSVYQHAKNKQSIITESVLNKSRINTPKRVASPDQPSMISGGQSPSHLASPLLSRFPNHPSQVAVQVTKTHHQITTSTTTNQQVRNNSIIPSSPMLGAMATIPQNTAAVHNSKWTPKKMRLRQDENPQFMVQNTLTTQRTQEEFHHQQSSPDAQNSLQTNYHPQQKLFQQNNLQNNSLQNATHLKQTDKIVFQDRRTPEKAEDILRQDSTQMIKSKTQRKESIEEGRETLGESQDFQQRQMSAASQGIPKVASNASRGVSNKSPITYTAAQVEELGAKTTRRPINVTQKNGNKNSHFLKDQEAPMLQISAKNLTPGPHSSNIVGTQKPNLLVQTQNNKVLDGKNSQENANKIVEKGTQHMSSVVMMEETQIADNDLKRTNIDSQDAKRDLLEDDQIKQHIMLANDVQRVPQIFAQDSFQNFEQTTQYKGGFAGVQQPDQNKSNLSGLYPTRDATQLISPTKEDGQIIGGTIPTNQMSVKIRGQGSSQNEDLQKRQNGAELFSVMDAFGTDNRVNTRGNTNPTKLDDVLMRSSNETFKNPFNVKAFQGNLESGFQPDLKDLDYGITQTDTKNQANQNSQPTAVDPLEKVSPMGFKPVFDVEYFQRREKLKNLLPQTYKRNQRVSGVSHNARQITHFEKLRRPRTNRDYEARLTLESQDKNVRDTVELKQNSQGSEVAKNSTRMGMGSSIGQNANQSGVGVQFDQQLSTTSGGGIDGGIQQQQTVVHYQQVVQENGYKQQQNKQQLQQSSIKNGEGQSPSVMNQSTMMRDFHGPITTPKTKEFVLDHSQITHDVSQNKTTSSICQQSSTIQGGVQQITDTSFDLKPIPVGLMRQEGDKSALAANQALNGQNRKDQQVGTLGQLQESNYPFTQKSQRRTRNNFAPNKTQPIQGIQKIVAKKRVPGGFGGAGIVYTHAFVSNQRKQSKPLPKQNSLISSEQEMNSLMATQNSPQFQNTLPNRHLQEYVVKDDLNIQAIQSVNAGQDEKNKAFESTFALLGTQKPFQGLISSAKKSRFEREKQVLQIAQEQLHLMERNRNQGSPTPDNHDLDQISAQVQQLGIQSKDGKNLFELFGKNKDSVDSNSHSAVPIDPAVYSKMGKMIFEGGIITQNSQTHDRSKIGKKQNERVKNLNSKDFEIIDQDSKEMLKSNNDLQTQYMLNNSNQGIGSPQQSLHYSNLQMASILKKQDKNGGLILPQTNNSAAIGQTLINQFVLSNSKNNGGGNSLINSLIPSQNAASEIQTPTMIHHTTTAALYNAQKVGKQKLRGNSNLQITGTQMHNSIETADGGIGNHQLSLEQNQIDTMQRAKEDLSGIKTENQESILKKQYSPTKNSTSVRKVQEQNNSPGKITVKGMSNVNLKSVVDQDMLLRKEVETSMLKLEDKIKREQQANVDDYKAPQAHQQINKDLIDSAEYSQEDKYLSLIQQETLLNSEQKGPSRGDSRGKGQGKSAAKEIRNKKSSGEKQKQPGLRVKISNVNIHISKDSSNIHNQQQADDRSNQNQISQKLANRLSPQLPSPKTLTIKESNLKDSIDSDWNNVHQQPQATATSKLQVTVDGTVVPAENYGNRNSQKEQVQEQDKSTMRTPIKQPILDKSNIKIMLSGKHPSDAHLSSPRKGELIKGSIIVDNEDGNNGRGGGSEMFTENYFILQPTINVAEKDAGEKGQNGKNDLEKTIGREFQAGQKNGENLNNTKNSAGEGGEQSQIDTTRSVSLHTSEYTNQLVFDHKTWQKLRSKDYAMLDFAAQKAQDFELVQMQLQGLDRSSHASDMHAARQADLVMKEICLNSMNSQVALLEKQNQQIQEVVGRVHAKVIIQKVNPPCAGIQFKSKSEEQRYVRIAKSIIEMRSPQTAPLLTKEEISRAHRNIFRFFEDVLDPVDFENLSYLQASMFINYIVEQAQIQARDHQPRIASQGGRLGLKTQRDFESQNRNDGLEFSSQKISLRQFVYQGLRLDYNLTQQSMVRLGQNHLIQSQRLVQEKQRKLSTQRETSSRVIDLGSLYSTSNYRGQQGVIAKNFEERNNKITNYLTRNVNSFATESCLPLLINKEFFGRRKGESTASKNLSLLLAKQRQNMAIDQQVLAKESAICRNKVMLEHVVGSRNMHDWRYECLAEIHEDQRKKEEQETQKRGGIHRRINSEGTYRGAANHVYRDKQIKVANIETTETHE